jgi:two-component sensor histidine kinase
MAIHELATNATKYGAFSTSTGTVSVLWSISDADPHAFTLTWPENGGPRVETPSRKGSDHA